MEMQGFQFVEVKRAHDSYRVFLKDSTFIGNYNEWEALLVANAVERAFMARHPGSLGGKAACLKGE